MKRKIILGLILVLIFTALSPLAAQYLAGGALGEPADFIESPTSFATRGRFTTGVDDYISAAYYTDVDFKNWFGFASFAMPDTGSIGYARKIGGIYLGLYYGGNLFMGYHSNEYTEVDHTWGGGTKKFKDYAGFPDLTTSSNDNRFAVLIGFGNMGLRFSYASNHDSFSGTDIYDNIGLDSYKSYDTALGWIIPQIQWGLTKPILPQGIQPTVTFDLGFMRDYERYEIYSGTTSDGEEVGYSANFIRPQLGIGLGGFTFYTGESFNAKLDLDYAFAMYLFNNDYSYQDAAGKYKTKSVKGINYGTGDAEELSGIYNVVTPSIGAAYTGNDRLGLAAKLSLPMGFESMKSTEYVILANGNLEKDGDDGSQFLFSLRPVLDLGLQYQAIPGKLTINIGGRIETALILLYSDNYDYYSGGSKVPNSNTKTHTTTFWSTADGRDAGTGLYAGLSFDFNEYFSLDSVMSYNTGTPSNGVNNVSLFGTGSGSLTAFYQILASLKF